MAKVARSTSIPVATGERLSTVHDFLRIFQAGAAAFAQPDLCCCGGITEFCKIAGMAEAFYVLMAPHVWGGPILTAASLQMGRRISHPFGKTRIGDRPQWKGLTKIQNTVEAITVKPADNPIFHRVNFV